MLFNVREKIRTPDTLVRSQVLYPAELRTRVNSYKIFLCSATVIILPQLFMFVNYFFFQLIFNLMIGSFVISTVL